MNTRMEIFKGNFVDLNYMSSICDGDIQFMIEMVETFLKDAPVITKEMTTLSKNNDWIKVSNLAHKFKTSLMFMGIESLHSVIREIEKNGQEMVNVSSIPPLVDQVSETCIKASQELSGFLNKYST